MKSKVLEILEDAYNVSGLYHTAIDINNSGTLNEEKLQKEKRLFLKSQVDYLSDELVEKVQHYPQDNISEVELKTDFVILKRHDLDYIKSFIENE